MSDTCPKCGEEIDRSLSIHLSEEHCPLCGERYDGEIYDHIRGECGGELTKKPSGGPESGEVKGYKRR